MRLALDSIEFAATEMPRFHAFLEDTYYISDGGLNAVEEMALGFVEIREIVRSSDRAWRIDVDSFAPRIAILVNCRMDLFEEVAKIRATRRIFARMMREEFGARDPRSWSCAITAHYVRSLPHHGPAGQQRRARVRCKASRWRSLGSRPSRSRASTRPTERPATTPTW